MSEQDSPSGESSFPPGHHRHSSNVSSREAHSQADPKQEHSGEEATNSLAHFRLNDLHNGDSSSNLSSGQTNDNGDQPPIPSSDPGAQLGSPATALPGSTVHESSRQGQHMYRWSSMDRFSHEVQDLMLDLPQSPSLQASKAIIIYKKGTPGSSGPSVWPHIRDSTELPVRYVILERSHGEENPESSSEYHLIYPNVPTRLSSRFSQPTQMAQSLTESLRSIRGPTPESNSIVSQNMDFQSEPRAGPETALYHSRIGRPTWNLPVEVVEMIAGYLSHDDIKCLRLVSREIDRQISQAFFKTVVVPFNTEIFGMLHKDKQSDIKGKNKTPKISWKNPKNDENYNGHGLDVFRGFGKHILRYGMSFEVSEASIAMIPEKAVTERHNTFWGSYDWPIPEYCRFDGVTRLESTADEIPTMKTAFAHLSKVKELALSIDNGLGWLNGPDRSIRDQILQRPPAIFGSPKSDRRTLAQKELWDRVKACYDCYGETGQEAIKLSTLYKMDVAHTLLDSHEAMALREGQPEQPYLDQDVILQATIPDKVPGPTDSDDATATNTVSDDTQSPSPVFGDVKSSNAISGILYSSDVLPSEAEILMGPIIPNNLTHSQKEWLMEIEWAQQAFLDSYVISIIDNPVTFSLVTTLNISQLSDRYISMLDRPDFWSALPNLNDVTLMVKPSWRSVEKDGAGNIRAPDINPLSGMPCFRSLLQTIADYQNVRTLTFGWATGGEHAEGLHGRNTLLSPAPLLPEHMIFRQLGADDLSSLLRFTFVERLTLKNCWVLPPTLCHFVKVHDSLCLKQLVLDMVSLTAIPWRPSEPMQFQSSVSLAPQALVDIMRATAHEWDKFRGQYLPFDEFMLLEQLEHIQAHAVGHHLLVAMALQKQCRQLQQSPMSMESQDQMVDLSDRVTQLAKAVIAAKGANEAACFIRGFVVPQEPILHSQVSLYGRPGDGSWLDIIDTISPGLNLRDFDNRHSRADPNRTTSLEVIELKSCGYAFLPYTRFGFRCWWQRFGSSICYDFQPRHSRLEKVMLDAKHKHLGQITQHIDFNELSALFAGWNLETGWKDHEKAQAVEFDGYERGGTGRISGTIRKSDRLVESMET